MFDEFTHLWQSRHLLWTLARREIAGRYTGSAGGIFWAYAPPLITVAAYFLVFDVVFAMRLGDNAPTHRAGAFLIVGALPWMGFCDSVGRGTNSLVDAGSILQKNALRPVLFVARTVIASGLIFLPLIALLTIVYIPLHRFNAGILALAPLILVQFALSFVLAYLFAILAAALRDTIQVVAFLLSIGIFLSPILFPLTLFPEKWRWLLFANPMTALVMGYQNVLLSGQWPGLQVWYVSAAWLAGGFLLLRVAVRRSRDQLVDWL